MMTAAIRPFLPRPPGRRRREWLALLATLAACWAGFPAASVAGPTNLFSFSAPGYPVSHVTNADGSVLTITNRSILTNSDGLAPASKLVLGTNGCLYGTTSHGGVNGAGSIFLFRLPPTNSLLNLYFFQPSSEAVTNNSGGTNYETNYDLGPNDLALGTNGCFYGTTRRGGTNFAGTIFEISPSGVFSNLYTFAAATPGTSGAAASLAGATPTGAMVLGTDSNFYGTTLYGGTNGTGTIFQFTHAGGFTSLYSFGPPVVGTTNTNGAVPNALIRGSDGAFYGTTQQGGLDDAGTFFKFTVAGGLKQIYSFNGGSPGNNPITPNSALVEGPNGNFYGTSAYGGLQGGGSIFELTNTGGATVLHSFPQLNAGAGAALITNSDGNFYGTTSANGLNGEGTVFRITPSGGFGTFPFGPLDPTNADNPGGANPCAGLTADNAGNLYGTCAAGGTNGWGVIFQVVSKDFSPPFFIPVTNPPPALTNTLVGASVTLSNLAQGSAPLSYQWLCNGTNNLSSDLSGSLTDVLVINPVFPRDVGSYTLVVSNTWGLITSAVTVLTVDRPAISVTSPTPNERTNSPVFSGTATNAPLLSSVYSNEVRLTNVAVSISNRLNGLNITNTGSITAGAGGLSHWYCAVTPYPGSNILSVQCRDASGNMSPVVSVPFFYEVTNKLTVRMNGSGTGTFTLTNGAVLNIGQSYSNTASPVSSVFNSWAVSNIWTSNNTISFSRTVPFVMQSNLVLTADFLAAQPPSVSISAPTARGRTSNSVFKGAATPSPLLTGVNSNNLWLTNVTISISNLLTGSNTGVTISISNVVNASNTHPAGSMTAGDRGVSNWSCTMTSYPGLSNYTGSNILSAQCWDASGNRSSVVSLPFFFEAPSLFILRTNGTGSGTFTGTAQVAGDTPPANRAMLNLGETYTITAKPDPFSTFSNWVGTNSAGATFRSNTPALTFTMQPGLVLTAVFAAIPPVVAISSPTANQRTAAPVFNGTAHGDARLTNVSFSLVSSFTGLVTNGSAALTAGTGSVSNWMITNVIPQPGTNTLTVRCVDAAGNASAAVSRTFFCIVTNTLKIVEAGGSGTFSGTASIPGDTLPAAGAKLNLGEGYTITVKPDSSSLFSNWVSAAGVAVTPVLPFVMQTNLVLTVNFISNFFPAAAGAYNGLFFPSNAVRAQTSGMLYNLILKGTGSFTASLLIAGKSWPVSTNFDISGQCAFPAGNMQVNLTLDKEVPQITGTVSASQWTANLTADLASNVLPSAEYTMLFSPSTNVSAVSPPGDGYALVTNDAGVVKLYGALADGTQYSQSVPVSRAGDVPLYVSLYTNTVGTNTNTSPGLLLGWINLTNLQAPANALAWIKNPSRSTALYTNGFTNILSLRGALWTNPAARTSAISLTNGELVLSNTGLFLNYTNIFVSNNTLTNLGMHPANFLTGSIKPANGLLTLTFAGANGKATNTAAGAVLQNAASAGGFILAATNAGSVILQP